MDEVLRDLVSRIELQHGPIFRADEIARWPKGVLEQFVQAGLLREGPRARCIAYDGCDEGCLVEPEMIEGPAGKLVPAFWCWREQCGGMVILDPACLRTWEVCVPKFVAGLARAAGAKGKIIEDVPGRIWMLGTARLGNRVGEFFLVRGLTWNDAAVVLDRSTRLKRSPFPVIFSPAHGSANLPAGPNLGRILPIEDFVSFAGGAISIDLPLLIERLSVSAGPTEAQGSAECDALMDAELDILDALSQSAQAAMLQVEIMAAAGYGKKTTSEALDRLRDLGLVNKPPGKQRKGDAITTKGLAYLAQRKRGESTTVAAKR